jgi:hypothetical protein
MIDMPMSFAQQCSRFADNELTTDEENLLLASCERNPDRYRQLALAMVERRRIGQLLAEVNDLSSTGDWANVSVDTTTCVQSGSANPAASHHQNILKAFIQIGVFAASLLVGIIVGYGTGRRFPNDAVTSSAVTMVPVNDSEPIDGVASSETPDANLPVGRSVGDATVNGDAAQSDETLVTLARRLKPTPTLDDQAVRALLDNGVDVERHNHVFLFDVSDGRQLAIPAEFTVLRTGPR